MLNVNFELDVALNVVVVVLAVSTVVVLSSANVTCVLVL